MKLVQTMKLILAVMMFFALTKMSYSYYEFLRIISVVFLIYFAVDARKCDQEVLFIIFIILAIIFQPFFKIRISKDLWQFIDLATGIFLIITLKPAITSKK